MAEADTTLTAPATAASRLPPGLANLLGRLEALSLQQKLAAGAALALAIALVVGLLLWSKPADYAVLFSNLDERDGGTIVTTLQQMNVPYRISDNGSAILVPSGQVHDLRLRLAAQGLPRGGNVGFELMDNQKLGITQFAEQINYQRAVEGELARTIQNIGTVSAARVHLAIPKKTGFLRDKEKPSASVMVTLRPGRVLDETQIAGIVHLVSSSVPELTPERVTVVDQSGNLLTRSPDKSRDELDAKQLAFIQELEAAYVRRVESILEPIVGAGNFKAQVAADVDFNQTELTSESYRPNPAPDQAIRSQHIEERYGGDQGPQGVPGALTNQPPVPATAPITTPEVGQGAAAAAAAGGKRERTATINYELDRTIQHTKKALGEVRRLTVAVVINQKTETTREGVKTIPSDEELAQLEKLVQNAVGLNPTRGDSITVSGALFAGKIEEPPVPWWKRLWSDPVMVGIVREVLRYLLIAAALGLVYFGVIRPLVRTVATKAETAAPGAPAAAPPSGAEEEEEGAIVQLGVRPGDPFERKVAELRRLAQSNPKLLANMIKEWLGTAEKR
ncbi:MAG: flagellar M-ring protein FliF [Rhodocyclales bacterium]|nr:flagellar M-ring protein FliF [Rhodocyclales bacterium]